MFSDLTELWPMWPICADRARRALTEGSTDPYWCTTKIRTRMGPYLSRTLIRVRRAFRQGSSGPVGIRQHISATSAKVRSGPKTSNLCRNGSRIHGLARNKDQMNRIGCPDPSGPLLAPKTAKNQTFQGKRTPAAPGGPRGLPHSYRRRPGPYVLLLKML